MVSTLSAKMQEKANDNPNPTNSLTTKTFIKLLYKAAAFSFDVILTASRSPIISDLEITRELFN